MLDNQVLSELLPVTVIITTYNDSQYLGEAINSVISQIGKPREIVVVDDGSVDQSAGDVAKLFIDNKYRISIKFYRKENGGASSARNFGLAKASQEYVTFLDADDKMLPNNLHSRFSEISTLGNDYFAVYSGGVTSRNGEYCFKNNDGVAVTDDVGKYTVGSPGGCCYYLFRRECFDDVGSFDESLRNNEDIDLMVRFSKAGYKCKSISEPGVYVNIRPDSLSRSVFHKKVFDGVMSFLDKAESKEYFSDQELGARRKSAYLAYGRAIIKQNPGESLRLFCYAFHCRKPEGIKEYTVYVISKVFSGLMSK